MRVQRIVRRIVRCVGRRGLSLREEAVGRGEGVVVGELEEGGRIARAVGCGRGRGDILVCWSCLPGGFAWDGGNVYVYTVAAKTKSLLVNRVLFFSLAFTHNTASCFSN